MSFCAGAIFCISLEQVYHWNKYIKAEMPFDAFEILYPDMPKHGADKMLAFFMDPYFFCYFTETYYHGSHVFLKRFFEIKLHSFFV